MSDFLTEEEQVERIKRWWSSNATAVIVGLIAALVVIGGWRGYQNYSKSRAEAASDAYREYLDARGVGGNVEAALATLDAEYSGTVYHVFVLLYQARDAAAEEDWDKAAELLSSASASASDPVLRDLARMRLAKIQYQLDRLDETLQTLSTVQSEGFKGAVAELTGDVHLARGENAQARQAYEAAVAASANAPRRQMMELKLASVSNES